MTETQNETTTVVEAEGNYAAAAKTLPIGDVLQAEIVRLCDVINDAANGKDLSIRERAQILADDGSEDAASLIQALDLVDTFSKALGLDGPSDYVAARSTLKNFLRMLVNDLKVVSREDVRVFETTVPKIRDDAADFTIDVKPRNKKS